MSDPLAPAIMLATSMHAQPGVYALLLGSGVSTGAGIPTGWQIATDLARQVATQQEPDVINSPGFREEVWWRDRFGEELSYSFLLEQLGQTQAMRQSLVAQFIEPTDDDRSQGLKLPSKAHVAIAELVKRGAVTVIITTNFDRLTEQALQAAGVSPQVISRPDAVAGMIPLSHAPATVIKLHGDYEDQQSLNTAQELNEYPSEWKDLISRVLDEYGLVISGWSATWDTALVRLLEAAPNRRYPLYWDSRSSESDVAKRLLSARCGQIIQSSGADDMFTALVSNLDALDRLTSPPLTTSMAVAKLKRYLPDPIHRIDLDDLVMGMVNEVVDEIKDQPLSESDAPQDAQGQWIENLFANHLRASDPLLRVLAIGIWFDDDLVHRQLWIDVVQRLIDAGTAGDSSQMASLRRARLYPAWLASAVMSCVAIRRSREQLVIDLGESPQARSRWWTFASHETDAKAGALLSTTMIPEEWITAMPRWNGSRWIAAQSHMLRQDLRAVLHDVAPDDADYKRLFDAYEFRASLIQLKLIHHPLWGDYLDDPSYFDGSRGQQPSYEQRFKQAAQRTEDWPWVDYFGGQEHLDEAVAEIRTYIAGYRNQRF
ncbi:SIR2 family protein [Propionibacterium freudenreichii]|uniref:SIR2 family protein n=1 Tax=Propionibacterium freudenreichii TaxID=1744 RepID=UPI0005A5CD3B|nr:SIR2 family protein [Propionibacterium freudenreichii]MDK9331988.1 SIR2 family protein [Propionibacterium freudenreichii]CEI30001.1 Sir2-family regulator [Propionibacterium freudenreichii]